MVYQRSFLGGLGLTREWSRTRGTEMLSEEASRVFPPTLSALAGRESRHAVGPEARSAYLASKIHPASRS
jgi:hypothetical protein